jgi:hypothetical protein
MAAKYEQFFTLMLDQNKETFDEFRKMHDLYSSDPVKYQDQFNQIGYDIQDLVQRYENMLCSNSESSGKGKFTSALSEKFQATVKKEFPKYSQIGMILD